MLLDKQGQPSFAVNRSHRANRGVHELLGFIRGIVADGVVHELEVEALKNWLGANQEILDIWPVGALAQRIERIYADGIVDQDEREDLGELIHQIVGRQEKDSLFFTPTDLPLTAPEPDVIFDGNEFVLTGRFVHGTRKTCQREIEMRGGKCGDTVRLQTSYLVIGSLTSRDWRYSSYGAKIETAVSYASKCPIAIVSEKHWQSFLLPA